jgi:hypothetical protein
MPHAASTQAQSGRTPLGGRVKSQDSTEEKAGLSAVAPLARYRTLYASSRSKSHPHGPWGGAATVRVRTT